MNKYYHRGKGEVVRPDPEQTNHFVYMQSLPITAYCSPETPIGLVENCREQYQMLNPIGEWVDCEESMWGLMAKHMRRIFLIPDAPVSGEEKVCLCKNVEVGSYHNQVELPAPDFMKSYLKARGQNTDTICVDTCLSFEIQNLWYWGITTTGCCCGHNKVPPYIGVIESDILRMRSFRYKSHQGKNDSFYPKTLPLPQSVKDYAGEVFNEQTLRSEIAKIWGEYGAHIDVYNELLKRAAPAAQGLEEAAKEYFDEYTGGNTNVATWTRFAVIEFAVNFYKRWQSLKSSTHVSREAVENNGGVLVLVGTDGKAFIVNDLIKWETDGSCETGDTLYSAIIVKKY